METSSAKRRKTSPTTAVPVDNNNNGASTTPPDPPPRSTRARRPSFASPTKASMSRHNPEIQSRRRPPASSAQSEQPASQPASRDGDESAEAERAARTERHSEADPPRARPLRRSPRIGELEGVAQSAPAAGAPVSDRRSPVRKLGGPMASKPRRSSMKPSPRPLPAPAPAEEDEVLNPFMGRSLRRSPTAGLPAMRLPAAETTADRDPEPELPPTPDHDPVVSTPPSGIHNTPSKKPRRSRAIADRIRSSPLKPSPLARPAIEGAADAGNGSSSSQLSISQQPKLGKPKRLSMGPSSSQPSSSQPSKLGKPKRLSLGAKKGWPSKATLKASEGGSGGESSQRTLATAVETDVAPGTNPFRRVRSRRSEDAPVKLRESLLAEITQLETDLDIARKENERIHQSQQNRQHSSLNPPIEPEVLDLLRRSVLPNDTEPEYAAQTQWLQEALNPMSFLPFGNPPAAFPSFLPSEQPEAEESLPKPISHHPTPMSAEEELPFLQVFTPLSFSSQIALLPREDADSPLYQRHSINVSSQSPPGLFTAAIEMTVNTKTLAVSDLAVPRLDPAAVAELRPFIEEITTGATNSAMTNNVGIITWAMGEWLRVATRRARTWHVLERELGTPEALRETVAQARTRRKRKRPRQAGAGASQGDDESHGQDGVGNDGRKGSSYDALSLADMLVHMGRTSMEFEIPAPACGDEKSTVRIQWRIGFDWTGEAQSHVGIVVGIPGKWRKEDPRGNLAGLSGLFNTLVQGDADPAAAVRKVAALIAGDVRQGGV